MSSFRNSGSSVSQTSFDLDGLEESLVDNNNALDDTDGDTEADDRRQQNQSFVRIRDALVRDADHRSEADIDLIHDFFVQLVVRANTCHALAHKDAPTRRLLCRHMVLAEIESRDTRVLTHGERLDAYCVVACGSLRHVLQDMRETCVDCADGDCSDHMSANTCGQGLRYLCVGDEFGASLDDRIVFGEIFTNEDFVWVLCVPHVIFDEICGAKSLRTVLDANDEHVIEVRDHNTNELIRATKERLLELMFATTTTTDGETTADDNGIEDDVFIADFLLTFRLFWFWPKARDDCVRELMARVLHNLSTDTCVDRNVKIALLWISNHFQDFDRKSLLALESCLKSKIHKKLLYFTLSTKSRERHVTLTRSDRAANLPFTLIGGYECSSRLFVSDVTDECLEANDLQRGDRLITINGVDCHVMEVSRALQVCKACTHLSLHVRFDPHLFHALLEGQISRNETKRHSIHTTETTTTTTGVTTGGQPVTTSTHSSFASLKPIQQLSSSLSSMTSNNWKQKVRQMVQNKLNHNNNNHNIMTTSPVVTTTTTTPTVVQPTPEIIKIHYESDFRYLPILATTTARECIQLALIEFQLNSNYSSRDFALYEYKLIDATTATSAVKRLSDNSQHLIKSLSLDSRLYLRGLASSGATPPDDADITREIARESRVNSLLTLDGEAIARELTERDFELFCRIESQQFIYDLTSGDDTDDDRRRQLKEFEDKTNSEMFWTINQILFSSNSCQKRIKTVKQLIRVATACRQLKNFNLLFAITSGLSHQSVQRLKQLWERIPQKCVQRLKKLYQLMDPSRNFGEFRTQLRRCRPPIIPFFPLVKKDLSFLMLANETFCSEVKDKEKVLINWQKMTQIAQNVRHVQNMTSSSSDTVLNDLHLNHKKAWERQRMRKRVQHFLDKSFSQIVCNENVLFDKSLECEPSTTPIARSSHSSSTLSSNQSSATALTTAMPSPSLSSHSSSPSLSSSSATNSSDIPLSSQRMRLRFGVRDDTGLRKLLALSDNCVNTINNVNIVDQSLNHLSSINNVVHSQHFLSSAPVFGSSRHPLPQESSSVTSLRRLEQLQRQTRLQLMGADFGPTSLSNHRMARPSLPSYDQTIQRMKKKFNKNEENVV